MPNFTDTRIVRVHHRPYAPPARRDLAPFPIPPAELRRIVAEMID